MDPRTDSATGLSASMTAGSQGSGSEPTAIPLEPRQRWRITFAREPVAPDAVGRAALEAWTETLRAGGLPVCGLEAGGSGRPRLTFAAPLPAACRGEAELADLWLLERIPAWRVREALADRLPPAHRWVGAHDVWLGAPALAGQVIAAEWLVALAGEVPPLGNLEKAAALLIAASSLPRTRSKGGADRPYDLRPLLGDVRVADHGRGTAHIRITTRIDPALGAGRPEEIVLALGEVLGSTLSIGSTVRQRLILAEPRPEPVSGSPPAGNSRPRRPSRR